jgi:hypothetical protein
MNEGMHQLHCLVSVPLITPVTVMLMKLQNLLRKSLWFQYDHYYKSEEGEFVTSNQGQPFRWHVSKFHPRLRLLFPTRHMANR